MPSGSGSGSGDELDPFTQVFDALWDLAEASVPLMSLVRRGNRIKFNSERDRSPEKQHVQAADVPELSLVTYGASRINLHANSSASEVNRIYQWRVVTADVRVRALLYPVEWALVCAMTDWKTALGSLTWRDVHYVKRAEMVSVSETMDRKGLLARGRRGWVAVWTATVQMYFQTSSMQGFNLG